MAICILNYLTQRFAVIYVQNTLIYPLFSFNWLGYKKKKFQINKVYNITINICASSLIVWFIQNYISRSASLAKTEYDKLKRGSYLIQIQVFHFGFQSSSFINIIIMDYFTHLFDCRCLFIWQNLYISNQCIDNVILRIKKWYNY